MIFAETIQFTPEQERALMTVVLVLIACFLLFVLGFFLSVAAGLRSGTDPDRTVALVYWAVWIAIELGLVALAVASGELVWIGIVGGMLVMTGGAHAFGRAFRPGSGTQAVVRPDPSSPAASPPANRDRGAPGSRP